MDWGDAETHIERLSATIAQKANALDLLVVARTAPAPESIDNNGYDAGLSLSWAGFEVAVYEDRYETYRFSDGDTVIKHWPRLPHEPIDQSLLTELPMAG